MTRYIVFLGVSMDGVRDDADNPGVGISTVDATSETAARELVEAVHSERDTIVTRARVYEMDEFRRLVEQWAADRADFVEVVEEEL